MRKYIFLFILLIASICQAATYTTNYNLTKPGVGDTGWGDAVNTNFDTIDTQMKANADATGDADSDSTWTDHNDYPSPCSAGQYVSSVGDTLTCGTPTDTDTTYTAGGTLLDLTSTTFSLNEGTLTDGKICTYESGTGIECDTTDADTDTTYTAGGTLLDLTGTTFSINEGTLTDTKYCTYEAGTGIECNSEGGSGGGLENVVEDLTPQLGGNLDTNGKWISGDGDSEGIFVDTAGNVGVGTSAPGYNLQVNGTTYFNGTSIVNSIYTEAVYDKSNGYYYLDSANTEKSLVVAGNVGIGTTAPAQKLDVSGKIALDGTTVLYRPTDMTGSLIVGDGGTNLSHTTGSEGYYNTFIGFGAGNATTTGLSNVAIGSQALYSNTTGYNNMATGYQALYSSTTVNNSIANGYRALYANTTGTSNMAIGYLALYANTTGSSNTATGFQSLIENTTGDNNTANGYRSLYSNITGDNNTTYGYQSGRFIANGSTGRTTGDKGVYIGANSKASADGTDNEIVIGYDATGVGSNSAVIGNDSVTKTVLKGNVGLGTSAPQNKLDVNGGAVIGSYAGVNTAPTNGLLVEGYVGIGTTSPSGNLDVVSTTGASVLNITGIAGQDSYLYFNEATSNKGKIYNDASADTMVFSDGGGTNLMYLKGGNVGIGTTAPAAKLDVSGGIAIDGTTCLDVSSDEIFHDTDCDGTKDAGEEFIDQAGGGSITGTDTYVTFFDGADSPAGDAGFTYNKTTDTATLAGVLTAETGLKVGDNTDQSFTFLTVDLLSSDETMGWDNTAGAFTLSAPLVIEGTEQNDFGTGLIVNSDQGTSAENDTTIYSGTTAVVSIDTSSDTITTLGTWDMGDSDDVLLPNRSFSMVLEDPADADSFPIRKANKDITITAIDCITVGGTSAVIDIQECTSAGASCASVDAAITCDSDGAADDGTFSNAVIDSGDWMYLDIGTVTGTVESVVVTVTYAE